MWTSCTYWAKFQYIGFLKISNWENSNIEGALVEGEQQIEIAKSSRWDACTGNESTRGEGEWAGAGILFQQPSN